MIVINRAKAEVSVWDRLRIERDARLVELDVLFMRALETAQDFAGIAAEKQALLDVTTKSLSGLSIDELSRLTLDEALAL